MDLLVTYDIDTTTPEGERRLTQIAKVCESYGTRVQYSVFECRLTATAFQRLLHELADLIDRRTDSINIYRFDGALSDARTQLGRPIPHEPGKPWIL